MSFALFWWIFPFSPCAAFNLIEGIDVTAIEAKIAKYQEENKEQITVNQARKVLLRMISSLVQSKFSLFHTCP